MDGIVDNIRSACPLQRGGVPRRASALKLALRGLCSSSLRGSDHTDPGEAGRSKGTDQRSSAALVRWRARLAEQTSDLGRAPVAEPRC